MDDETRDDEILEEQEQEGTAGACRTKYRGRF